jgi:hypothetical protein
MFRTVPVSVKVVKSSPATSPAPATTTTTTQSSKQHNLFSTFSESMRHFGTNNPCRIGGLDFWIFWISNI